MVSRKDIEDFYKKYKKNLDAEAQVIDRLLQAEDQEIWLEKLRKKARSMRNLYIENEALLNLYVRPFLSGEVLLNDERLTASSMRSSTAEQRATRMIWPSGK